VRQVDRALLRAMGFSVELPYRPRERPVHLSLPPAGAAGPP
jgi:hypothetical protein